MSDKIMFIPVFGIHPLTIVVIVIGPTLALTIGTFCPRIYLGVWSITSCGSPDSFIFQQTYNIVDAAIVGNYLGTKALASVGASASVQFLVMGFCIGICCGFGQ